MIELERCNYLQGECGDQYPHALPKYSTDLENDRGQPLGCYAQTVPHIVVGAVNLSFVEHLHEEHTY